MNHLKTTLTIAVLAAAALGSAACGDAGGGDVASDVAALKSQLSESKRKNDQLADRIGRLEKRIDGLTQDVDRIAHERVKSDLAQPVAVADGSDGDSAAAMAEESQPTPKELIELLNSADGQDLVAKAMEAVEQRRDQARRERMVASMVDRFAESANLTPAQTDDVTRIVSESFTKMGDLWSSMRNTGDMTAEQRATIREENMLKMEEIRQATNDEMKAVLNSEQYGIYEEQANRMRGWGGGRGR